MLAETQQPKCPRSFTWKPYPMLKKLALGALVLMFGVVTPGFAADKAGPSDGLADLEERVAELETTVARKGNRRMSLTLYGQINKGVLWLNDGSESQFKFTDGHMSGTRVGIMGSAKVSPNFDVGYKVELGINDQPSIPVLEDQVTVREANWWVKSAVGKFTVGLQHIASSDVAGISVANNLVASQPLGLQPLANTVLFGINLPFSDIRRNAIRFDSNDMGGFILSGSYAKGDTPFGMGFSDGDAWDVALRYAAEMGGFRVAGGIAYSQQDQNIWLSPIVPTGRDRVISGSASVKHLASGFFVNGSVGDVQGETVLGGGDYRAYQGTAGWEGKINTWGTLTIYGEYGTFRMAGLDPAPSFYGAGIVHTIDAAAMDLYLSGRVYQDLLSDDLTAIMAGARVRF